MSPPPNKPRPPPERIGKRHARPSAHGPDSSGPVTTPPERTAPTLERTVSENAGDEPLPLEKSVRERPRLRVPKP